jgi:hypothetical protein
MIHRLLGVDGSLYLLPMDYIYTLLTHGQFENINIISPCSIISVSAQFVFVNKFGVVERLMGHLITNGLMHYYHVAGFSNLVIVESTISQKAFCPCAFFIFVPYLHYVKSTMGYLLVILIVFVSASFR